MFVDDLMDMFPEARIILNQRASGEVWAESISNSLQYFHSKTYLVTCFLIKTDRLHYQVIHETLKVFRKRAGLNVDNPFTPQTYDIHNQWVRDEAAKRGREVLDWQAEEGWKPLAAFLRKPAPDVPFPRMNDQRTMMIVKTILTARGLLAWSALAGALYTAVSFARKWL
jgi:Sulfotransferase domain